MERTKYTQSIIIFLLATAVCSVAQPWHSDKIYKAFITGDMQLWKQTMATVESNELDSEEEKLQLVEYYYGYCAWLVGTKKTEEAKIVTKKAEMLIDDILQINPNEATARAFKGAFIGYSIAINPLKAPFIGQKSLDEISRALQLDPQNRQALLQHANALYYRPALFGGDKKAAIDFYEQAVFLFEQHGETERNWNYLNALTVLAQAYEATDQPTAARGVFEKILEHEPNYSWVRDELYPELLQKMQVRTLSLNSDRADSPQHFASAATFYGQQ